MCFDLTHAHQSVQQKASQPLTCLFSVDGLDVWNCFDWFVNDEIIRTKSVQNHFFSRKIYKSAPLTVITHTHQVQHKLMTDIAAAPLTYQTYHTQNVHL